MGDECDRCRNTNYCNSRPIRIDNWYLSMTWKTHGHTNVVGRDKNADVKRRFQWSNACNKENLVVLSIANVLRVWYDLVASGKNVDRGSEKAVKSTAWPRSNVPITGGTNSVTTEQGACRLNGMTVPGTPVPGTCGNPS
jgi:hypothetical protein